MKRKINMTETRRAIFETLLKMKTHPTAADLHSVLRKQMPDISMSTVCRNLEALSNAGMIRRVLSGNLMRYDADTTRHDHFRCTRCQKIADVHSGIRRNMESFVLEDSGFVVLDYQVQYIGLCDQCRKHDENDA